MTRSLSSVRSIDKFLGLLIDYAVWHTEVPARDAAVPADVPGRLEVSLEGFSMLLLIPS